MAIEAGKTLHPNTVDAFVLVAVLAGSSVWLEKVKAFAVATFALYVFHKYMPCMAVGFPQGQSALRNFIEVAFFATLPWLNPSMGLRKLR
jgi:hypothetical protein